MTNVYLPPVIILPDYWYQGSEMILRETLPPSHPEHPYNYIKRTYKIDPERYGIKKEVPEKTQ